MTVYALSHEGPPFALPSMNIPRLRLVYILVFLK